MRIYWAYELQITDPNPTDGCTWHIHNMHRHTTIDDAIIEWETSSYAHLPAVLRQRLYREDPNCDQDHACDCGPITDWEKLCELQP